MVRKMSKPVGISRYFKPALKAESPEPPPKRAPSPPHEYTLADNDAIAFIVMFTSRFHEAFPKYLTALGPQDIERGVSGELPDELVEKLLCALLGLVLNRKKDVELVYRMVTYDPCRQPRLILIIDAVTMEELLKTRFRRIITNGRLCGKASTQSMVARTSGI